MRPIRHFGHMGAAASYVKTNARFELVCEAYRLQSRQVGSHDPHKLFMNVLAGKERRFVYCLLSRTTCNVNNGKSAMDSENYQRMASAIPS